MNTRKVLMSMTVVLMLIMSVSVASAGIKLNNFNSQNSSFWNWINPKIVDSPSTTPLGDCIKTWFNKCTSNITPISKGELFISGDTPTDVWIGQQHTVINVLVESTFYNTITDSITVLVTGKYNQKTYYKYSREVPLHYGTNIENFIVDISNFEYGDYDVLISIPVQNGENNNINNKYRFVMHINPSPPTTTPTPTPTPTPAPTPLSGFDVIVSAKVPTQINVGDSLNILTTVAHNRKKTVEDKLWVTVTGAYPATTSDFTYSLQTYKQPKELIMAHHDTVISDEDTWFYFPTNGWNPGIYHVTVIFPTIPGEINTINNKYETDVKVIGIKQPDITDVGINAFNFELFYDLPGQSDGTIVRGENYYIDYAIRNYGNQKEVSTFLITCEGTTLYSSQLIINANETKSGKILLDSSYIPFKGTLYRDSRSILIMYKHTITGEVITAADSNSKNDKATTYLIER